MEKIKNQKNKFQSTVEVIINSIEAIHKSISDNSCKIIEVIGVFESEAAKLKKNKEDYIHGVYEVIRDVNQRIGELFDYILEQMEKSEAVERNNLLELTSNNETADMNFGGQ